MTLSFGSTIGILGGGQLARMLAMAAAQTPQAPHKSVRVALVLSGGGLRGLAHLGVLKVLEQQGLRPDLVVGTSVGAIVGGAYASGTPVKDLEALSLPAALDFANHAESSHDHPPRRQDPAFGRA